MKSRLQISLLVFALTLVSAMTLNAQGGANLSPPSLTPSIQPVQQAPVPVDENGNPIPVQPPTAEQLEAIRIEQERRQEAMRIEEERVAAENARRAEEDRRAAELLAEQKQFHDRITWAVYIALGLLAIFVGSRLFKKEG